jgi:hypothetical protein
MGMASPTMGLSLINTELERDLEALWWIVPANEGGAR